MDKIKEFLVNLGIILPTNQEPEPDTVSIDSVDSVEIQDEDTSQDLNEEISECYEENPNEVFVKNWVMNNIDNVLDLYELLMENFPWIFNHIPFVYFCDFIANCIYYETYLEKSKIFPSTLINTDNFEEDTITLFCEDDKDVLDKVVYTINSSDLMIDVTIIDLIDRIDGIDISYDDGEKIEMEY